MRALVIAFVLLISTAAPVSAEVVQIRFGVGGTNTTPTAVNDAMKASNQTEFGRFGLQTIEVTYPVLKVLNLGGRVVDANASNMPPGGRANSYETRISSASLELLARVPIVRTSFFVFDFVGGYGLSNSTIHIFRPNQDGDLKRGAFEGSVTSSIGTSVAVGYGGYYLALEGGLRSSKVENLNRSGTLTSDIPSLDLSGPYALISVMTDGFARGSGGGSKK